MSSSNWKYVALATSVTTVYLLIVTTVACWSADEAHERLVALQKKYTAVRFEGVGKPALAAQGSEQPEDNSECITIGTLGGDEESRDHWQQIFVRRVPCEAHTLRVSEGFFGRAGAAFKSVR